jgi:hypothetical protein
MQLDAVRVAAEVDARRRLKSRRDSSRKRCAGSVNARTHTHTTQEYTAVTESWEERREEDTAEQGR